MKKILIGLVAAIALLGALALVFRGELQMAVMYQMMKPEAAFADTAPPAAPDYQVAAGWAALPDRDDNADVLPKGVPADDPATSDAAAVDVFFIHPTTYYESDSWNQPLDDATANTMTDDSVLTNQAAVFNGCCRVHAPRYRQATLFAFFDLDGDGGKAIDLAYQDVVAAFEHFLTHFNQGRPFILAGHSQGALHADRLLRDRIQGTELQGRMVAAYPVGYWIDGSNGIPVCETPTQTGCQVTWNSGAPDLQPFRETAGDICVNPLTWRTDGVRADFADNLGGVAFGGEQTLISEVADAMCKDGRLVVSDIRSDAFDSEFMGPGNYHIYDYGLFFMNIRRNAAERVAAYMAAGVQP